MIRLPQMFHRSLLRQVSKRLGKEGLLRSKNRRILVPWSWWVFGVLGVENKYHYVEMY